jgi:hypothetical protein
MYRPRLMVLSRFPQQTTRISSGTRELWDTMRLYTRTNDVDQIGSRKTDEGSNRVRASRRNGLRSPSKSDGPLRPDEPVPPQPEHQTDIVGGDISSGWRRKYATISSVAGRRSHQLHPKTWWLSYRGAREIRDLELVT